MSRCFESIRNRINSPKPGRCCLIFSSLGQSKPDLGRRLRKQQRFRGWSQRARLELIPFLCAVLDYCRAFLIDRHRPGLELAALRRHVPAQTAYDPRFRYFDRIIGLPSASVARTGEGPDPCKTGYRGGLDFVRWRARSRPQRCRRPNVSVEIIARRDLEPGLPRV